jgi:hypothetical protein
MDDARSKRSRKNRPKDSWPLHHNSYPFYAFRIWLGMGASAWFRLLARNHFAISPVRIPLALQLSVYSIINSLLKIVQDLFFAKRIAEAVIVEPPIFIIGHWRTGTTYLHELLTLDERFTAPTTLECFAPGHFLVSGWLLRMLAFFLPARRPMDDMLVGWDRPQEDEFALVNLGIASPYETLAFPNHRPVGSEFLNMTEVTKQQIDTWKAGLLSFLQAVNFCRNRKIKRANVTKRIVLKSPTHTARLHILRQMFPTAQFIHVVRHPSNIFASTVWLWRALYETQGFQKPEFGPLSDGGPSVEEYVLDTMELLYRDFFTQVSAMPPRHFCEVRYEDLIAAPVTEMSRIYRELNFGPVEPIRAKLEAYVLKLSGYKPNDFAIPEEHRVQVSQRWRWYMERYNYQISSSGAGAART